MNAALWDMDGTLVDTAELHFVAWRDICLKYGRGFTREEFYNTFGRRNEEIIPILFGSRFDGAASLKLADEKEQLYRDEAAKGVDLLEGAETLLRGFAAQGWKQAIGSSAPRANVEMILDLTKTRPLFQAVVSGGDVQHGKPAPDVFLAGAKMLGVAPAKCLVFEDAPVGVLAAKAAGMRCIAVTLRSHHSREELLAAGADLVVKSLREVPA